MRTFGRFDPAEVDWEKVIAVYKDQRDWKEAFFGDTRRFRYWAARLGEIVTLLGIDVEEWDERDWLCMECSAAVGEEFWYKRTATGARSCSVVVSWHGETKDE